VLISNALCSGFCHRLCYGRFIRSVIGVQFSAPVLAILLLSGLILGILARVFPQLNVFLLSFPVNIGTGFIVIALTLNLGQTIIRREIDTIAENFGTLLNYLNF